MSCLFFASSRFDIMSNDYSATYRILDTLSKLIDLQRMRSVKCCCCLERANLNKDEDSDSLSYLTVDNRDKTKKKYVMKIVDLEKLNNLNEFIVGYSFD